MDFSVFVRAARCREVERPVDGMPAGKDVIVALAA
jgi:hypothetical protein